ncbi:MAG: hypothetical protein JWP27_1933 [Flaviaesturariibacter sp.]|nr:hypothetical protein [Flaviaesturariibacter sp.]
MARNEAMSRTSDHAVMAPNEAICCITRFPAYSVSNVFPNQMITS